MRNSLLGLISFIISYPFVLGSRNATPLFPSPKQSPNDNDSSGSSSPISPQYGDERRVVPKTEADGDQGDRTPGTPPPRSRTPTPPRPQPLTHRYESHAGPPQQRRSHSPPTHLHQQPVHSQHPHPPKQQQQPNVRLPDMSLPPPVFPAPSVATILPHAFPVTLPATVPTHHTPSFPPAPAPGPYPGVPLTQPPRWDTLRDSEGYVKDPLAAFEAAMMKKDRRYKRSRSRSPPPPYNYPRRYSPPHRQFRYLTFHNINL
jgi:hypothetical protein